MNEQGVLWSGGGPKKGGGVVRKAAGWAPCHTLTADDFVPVHNSSEYIKEKKLKLLTFLLLESRFMVA